MPEDGVENERRPSNTGGPMPISINGKAYDVPADARVSLLDLLRDRYPSTLPALQPAHENVRSFASDTRNGLSAFHPKAEASPPPFTTGSAITTALYGKRVLASPAPPGFP